MVKNYLIYRKYYGEMGSECKHIYCNYLICQGDNETEAVDNWRKFFEFEVGDIIYENNEWLLGWSTIDCVLLKEYDNNKDFDTISWTGID